MKKLINKIFNNYTKTVSFPFEPRRVTETTDPSNIFNNAC